MDNRHSHKNKRNCHCQGRFQKKSSRKIKCCHHYDCRDFFQVNFSGLTNNLNYKLLKHKGCELEMNTIDGRRKKRKTDHIGIDFVDIKNENGHIVTVLKDKIVSIDWLSRDCSPDHDMKKRCDRKQNKKRHDHDDCCRKHDEKDCHDEFEWWEHDKKECHDDCHCRKHHKKDCHDEFEWWKHDKKECHESCRCRKHHKKGCHDEFEWWKHHKRDCHCGMHGKDDY